MNPSYSKNPAYVEAQAVPVEAFVPVSAVHATADGTPAPANFTSPINEAGAREFLSGHKWPVGLQDTFIHNLSKIPIRFFICDDSGSMIASDGHRMLTGGGNSK